MIKVEYIRDMHSNYMVLKGIEGSVSGYGVKMLLNNTIQGMLKVKLKCIDQTDLFYYEITSQKSIASVYEKKSMYYDEIKHILTSILTVIDYSGEYLLSENDFIIDPEYIYCNTDSQSIALCHLVGYQENIKEQVSKFIEYLMNKVDYKDEQAVLLIYAMYKESKEADCTFEKLLQELNRKVVVETNIKKIGINAEERTSNGVKINNKRDSIINNNSIDQNIKMKSNGNISNVDKSIGDKDTKNRNTRNRKTRYRITWNKFMNKNIMNQIDKNKNREDNMSSKLIVEEIENEHEILYFDRKTYSYAGLSILIGIALIGIAFKMKMLHNSFGTHLDAIKVLCSILILFTAEIYVLIKVFDKKNRITRMESSNEYVERSSEYMKQNKEGIEQNKEGIEQNKEGIEPTQLLWVKDQEVEQNRTIILADLIPQKQYYLESYNVIDTIDTIEIPINTYPFIIGKISNKVNLAIDDMSVSRLHAKITREGDNIYLIDLSSTNGTYINGIRLVDNKYYLLSPNDVISISQKKYYWKENIDGITCIKQKKIV